MEATPDTKPALAGKAPTDDSLADGSGSSDPGKGKPDSGQGDVSSDSDEPTGQPHEDNDGSPSDRVIRVREQIEFTDDDFEVSIEFVCPEPIRDAFTGRSRGRFVIDFEHIDDSTSTLRVTAAAVID